MSHANESPSMRAPGMSGPVHFLGLGGAGVSGAARVLAARGVTVSGHDRAPSDLLRAFQRDVPAAAVTVAPSAAEHLPWDAALVVRSAAVPDDDPQVALARERGLPVLKYAELLAALPAPGRGLAVAGTHGKTTTSWLAWHALLGIVEAGLAQGLPGALVGGLVAAEPGGLVDRVLGTRASEPLRLNAHAGDAGGWFVVEACEYDRSFLQLDPGGAIVTNVEADHLDFYGDLAAIEKAFGLFAGRVQARGLLVLGSDVPEVVEAGAEADVWRLGRELRVEALGLGRAGRRFRLIGPGWATPVVELGVPGAYNVSNAALALGLAIGLAVRDLPRERWDDVAAAAARGVMGFMGSARRFELWGEHGAVRVVHDYAHHPTELAALLAATRETFPEHQLHMLFQPHQESRTARFLEGFAKALAPRPDARLDRLVVAPVYGARRHIDGANAAGSEALAERVNALGGLDVATAPAALGAATVEFCMGLDPAVPTIALVVGAGDVEEIREPLFAAFSIGHLRPAARRTAAGAPSVPMDRAPSERQPGAGA